MHFKELQRKSFARMTQQTEHVCQRFQMLLLVSLNSVYGLFQILRTVLFTITSQTQNPETHMCKNVHINNF